MDINLLAMPEGKKSARSCKLDMFPDPGNPEQKKNKKFDLVSLFKKKRMKGFWPFYNEAEGERVLAVSTTVIDGCTCIYCAQICILDPQLHGYTCGI